MTKWATYQRVADRLAQYAWLILLLAVALTLVGGAATAATWQPRATGAPAVPRTARER